MNYANYEEAFINIPTLNVAGNATVAGRLNINDLNVSGSVTGISGGDVSPETLLNYSGLAKSIDSSELDVNSLRIKNGLSIKPEGTNTTNRLTIDVNGNIRTSGSLNVGSNINTNNNITITHGSGSGPSIKLINPNKLSSTQTRNWTIWNMTGRYGNKLSFWRYMGDGKNAGSTMEIFDNGYFQTLGDINTRNGKIREGGSALIPTGSIIMWSGTTAPAGWALCDGKNRTPDLRGRFVLGMGKGSGLTNRTLRQTGGAETHTLNINEIPAHNHSLLYPLGRNHGRPDGWRDVGGAGRYNTSQSNSVSRTNNTGNSSAHNNMPPFYVLAYIMKL